MATKTTPTILFHIEAVQHGDQQAFESLYYESLPVLRAVCERYFADGNEVEDAIQESYVKIYKNITSLKNPEAFPAWSKRIAENTCLNIIRSRNLMRSREEMRPMHSNDENEGIEDLTAEDYRKECNPEAVMESGMKADLVRQILSSLTDTQRSCILLWSEGYTYQMIAQRVGLPLGSVKSTIFYTKRKVTAAVLEIEKTQKIRLHMAPIPFFLFLLSMPDVENAASPGAVSIVSATAAQTVDTAPAKSFFSAFRHQVGRIAVAATLLLALLLPVWSTFVFPMTGRAMPQDTAIANEAVHAFHISALSSGRKAAKTAENNGTAAQSRDGEIAQLAENAVAEMTAGTFAGENAGTTNIKTNAVMGIYAENAFARDDSDGSFEQENARTTTEEDTSFDRENMDKIPEDAAPKNNSSTDRSFRIDDNEPTDPLKNTKQSAMDREDKDRTHDEDEHKNEDKTHDEAERNVEDVNRNETSSKDEKKSRDEEKPETESQVNSETNSENRNKNDNNTQNESEIENKDNSQNETEIENKDDNQNESEIENKDNNQNETNIPNQDSSLNEAGSESNNNNRNKTEGSGKTGGGKTSGNSSENGSGNAGEPGMNGDAERTPTEAPGEQNEGQTGDGTGSSGSSGVMPYTGPTTMPTQTPTPTPTPSPTQTPPPDISVQRISIGDTFAHANVVNYVLNTGDSYQIPFTIYPANATDKITWSVTGSGVTIDENGVVTNHGSEGVSKIIARAGNVRAEASMIFTNVAQSFSGKCGDNVFWEVNGNTLHFYGTGDMWPDEGGSRMLSNPWLYYANEITAVQIDSGITSIEHSAFYGLYRLTEVRIPNGVTKLGDWVFVWCRASVIHLPNTLQYVSGSAIWGINTFYPKIVFHGTWEEWDAVDKNGKIKECPVEITG